MKNNLLFSFSRQEKKGLIILSVIILFEITILLYPFKKKKQIIKSVTQSNNFEKEDEKKLPPSRQKTKKINVKKHAISVRLKKSEQQNSDSFKKKNNYKIDINTTDTNKLKKLKGIGTILSKRIIKFRKVLGGFSNIEQLKEVYGITPELFSNIKDQLVLSNKKNLKKININIDDFKSILKHPYISYNLTKIIVNKRKYKKYTDLQELKAIPLISDSLFNKLLPYLTL